MSQQSTAAVTASPSNRRRLSRWSTAVATPSNRAVALLVFVVVVCGVIDPGVLSIGSLQVVVSQSVPVTAVALGTMLVLLTGAIDLSVGAVTSLSAVVLARSVANGENLAIAILGALAVGAAVGAINAALVAGLRLPSFVVTLGTLSAASGLTIILSGDISLDSNQLSNTAGAHILGVRADVLVIVGIGILLHTWLTHTRFGVGMRGVGSDEHAAGLLGLSVPRARTAAFVASGMLAAITATLLVARTPVVTPQLGGSLLLDAFAAAVIGGTSIFGGRGTAFGTILGAVLIAFVGNFLVSIGVSPSSIDLYRGLIILLALLLDAVLTHVERRQQVRL